MSHVQAATTQGDGDLEPPPQPLVLRPKRPEDDVEMLRQLKAFVKSLFFGKPCPDR